METSLNFPSELDAVTERAVLRVIQECMVNAVRHGGAHKLWVEAHSEAALVTLSVSDDGSGFSFRGEYEHDTLIKEKMGPVSLKRRIQALGGRMSIHSSDNGARVLIRLPLDTSAGGVVS